MAGETKPKTTDQGTTVVNILKNPKDFDIYVGRAGLGFDGYFGNPYRIGRDGTREEVVEKFRRYFQTRLSKDREFYDKVNKLKGLRLGCFCSNTELCHARVIARYLNSR